jgi:hypothetical protein
MRVKLQRESRQWIMGYRGGSMREERRISCGIQSDDKMYILYYTWIVIELFVGSKWKFQVNDHIIGKE